jgi:Mg2+/Co2+ transporter CorC
MLETFAVSFRLVFTVEDLVREIHSLNPTMAGPITILLASSDFDNVAGEVANHFGILPGNGDKFTLAGLTIERRQDGERASGRIGEGARDQGVPAAESPVS